MPFAKADRPSAALGLLKAALLRDGVDCDVAYLNLAFAGEFGVESYCRIVEDLPQAAMAGDWIFAGCLYEDDAPPASSYVHRVLRARLQLDEDAVATVLAARSAAPEFLSGMLEELAWTDYDIVGFTCACGQTLASLALARLAKQRQPRLLTVFGGPAWHGAMGRTLFTLFPFVDAACLGEGDVAFPSFARALAQDGLDAAGKIPGMLARPSRRAPRDRAEQLVQDLDALPIPDYGDYFKALTDYRAAPGGGVVVPMEASRGCWWAAAGPCRFCGLNGLHRAYRTKSASRVVSELRILAGYPGCGVVELVDNIASPAVLSTVLPQLAVDPLHVPLEMEIRPDIGRRTVELLAEAGARTLAGIESLSEHVLTLMGKGIGTLENVRVLKWCEELGVRVCWNLIYGFPGETADDYDDILAVIHSIPHLSPPDACGPVRIERFSPYHEDPASYGFINVRPAAAYSYLHPFDDSTVADLAFFFDHDYAPGFEPPRDNYRIRSAVYDWGKAASACDLRLAPTGDVVLDSRRPDDRKIHHLDGLERTLYAACDDICSRAELEELVRRSGPDGEELVERIDEALAWFVERGLMLRRHDLYLSLALPESAPSPETPATAASETEQGQLRGA